MLDRNTLHKIYLLACDSGATEHERKTAYETFLKLCEKYSFDPASFEDINYTWVRFTYQTKMQLTLLEHCIFKVLNKNKFNFSSHKRKRYIRVEVSETQAAEIDKLYHFYRRHLEKELKRFIHAFVLKHKLFAETKSDEAKEGLTLTEVLKIQEMMATLENIKPPKNQLGTGNGESRKVGE